ncbi:MAG: hypothetical protein AB1458_09560 [Bacteroidota bacterium]
MRTALCISACLLATLCGAQNLAAYFDYKNYFFVFDNGVSKELEYQKVEEFKVGGNAVAYLNNNKELKIYYNGKADIEEPYTPHSWQVSASLVCWKLEKRFMVFDQGETKKLTDWVLDYQISDSMIAFNDYYNSDFKVYYKGEVITLETGGFKRSVNNYMLGKNTLAFFDLNNNFKIFYRGKIYDIGTNDINRGFCGLDIVTFTNRYTNEFSIFYKGEIILLETVPPKQSAVGDALVAWTDNYGSLKVFYDYGTTELSSFEPSNWGVYGNFVSFNSDPEWKVFYMGKTYVLENNLPFTEPFANYGGVGIHSIAWTDKNGKLKYFFKGEIRTNITYEKIASLAMYRDILVFTTGISTTNVFWEGKVY